MNLAERKLLKRDFATLADQIAQEFSDRKERRRDRSLIWTEIDRQVAMQGLIPKKRDGRPENSWFPCIELPLQANSVEVLTADVRRLALPPGNDWFTSIAFLTDEHAKKLEGKTLIAGVDREIPGGKVDQDTMNLMVHAVLDHFHSQYDYRGVWDRLFIEGIKYGSFVGRIGVQKTDVLYDDFRSIDTMSVPMIFPVSIKNVFLDDSRQHVLHEGVAIAPSYIRQFWRKEEDLKIAAQTSKGWQDLSGLEEGRGKHVHLIEIEGDFIVERARGEDMYLPSFKATVAMQAVPQLVRWMPMETPFRSYIGGVYMPEDSDSPYGTSPLMKGRPIQEAASMVANRVMAVAALQAEPPSAYDASDSSLVANGGPIFEPGSQFPSDRPGDIKVFDIGDLNASFAVLTGLLTQYEQTTQVNDPRRGAGAKSHTTAYAADVDLSRGLLRTEDFVEGAEQGPMKDSLYKEYWFARKYLKPSAVLVNARGTQGFLQLEGKDLPERAEFVVDGSRGVINKREKRDSVFQFATFVANLTPLLAQMGSAPQLKEILLNVAAEYDIIDAERFFPQPKSSPIPGQPPIGTAVPAAPSGVQGPAGQGLPPQG